MKYLDRVKIKSWFYEWIEWILDSIDEYLNNKDVKEIYYKIIIKDNKIIYIEESNLELIK